jgi:AraC-like DNA-binding protein
VSLTGGGPGGARIVCGFLGCDARPFNPLLAALPRVIHLPGSRQGTPGVRQLIDLALAESTTPRPGSDGMLSRLSEVLFLEVVRFFTATLAPDQVGWFAALRDPTVGLALGRLHARAAQPWTLQSLARDIGTSRSVLAERFARLVGMPPLQYLARWRIQLAANLLRTSSLGLSEIADRVGYGSEAALSRAFKRTVGVSPALYRGGRSGDPDAGTRERDARSF